MNTCEITTADIAGSYQITKLETVSYNTGAVQDITSTLTPCELSGIYQFNTDSTANYTESTNCNGRGSGTWRLSGIWLIAELASVTGNLINGTIITSWDCTHLMVMTQYPSVDYNFRITLTNR